MEKESTHELEAFRANLRDAIDNVLSFLELDPTAHFGLDTESLGLDQDLDNLSANQLQILHQTIIEILGIDLTQSPVDTYDYIIPDQLKHPGTVQAEIYPTTTDEVFLHILKFPDGATTYSVGPNEPSISFE